MRAGEEGGAALMAIGTYFPPGYQTSAEIAGHTGIPQAVIEQKFGLRGKHIAAADEHVSDMAVRAAAPLLDEVPAEEVGALIYFGSAHKDYYLWSVAPKIQHAGQGFLTHCVMRVRRGRIRREGDSRRRGRERRSSVP